MLGSSLRSRVAAGAGCLCLALTSCMGPRYEPIPETGATLTGTVKYKNEPLKMGMVIVAGATGGTAEIGPDGHYTVANAPLGDVTVAVNMSAAKGKLMSAAKGDPKAAAKVPNIPGKYTDPATSPLKTTVNKGPNTFDIVIE